MVGRGGMRKSRGTRKYINHAGQEMYRYNAVWPLDIFRMVQEVANANNRTIIMQLTVWVREGYERWKEESRKARVVSISGGVRDASVDMPTTGWVSPGETVTR